MPTVSVVVPNYNHARHLRRRIDSILAQSYEDFELILLDDCSEDDSRAVIGEYENNPRVRIEFNEKNSGSPFKQWNKGVRMARGRYAWIAESDDYADERFLASTVAILEEHPDVSFAYCRSWTVGENDDRQGFADGYLNCLDAKHWTADFIVDGLEECRRFFALTNPIPNASAVLFRKAIYEKVGLADEGLRVCGDYKVWAAMALEGKIAYVAEPLNYFRSHGENVRTRAQAGALDVFEYYYAMLEAAEGVEPPESHEAKGIVGEILAYRPSELSPQERIEASQRALFYLEGWNKRHNGHVPQAVILRYFENLKCMLVFREFAIFAPTRWRFFSHRLRFYRYSFPEMNWRLRIVNLMRVLGAPIVGYRRRHWPGAMYERVTRVLRAS